MAKSMALKSSIVAIVVVNLSNKNRWTAIKSAQEVRRTKIEERWR